jgi:predicted molibdopterin-dependent oxidoreductase YjgC
VHRGLPGRRPAAQLVMGGSVVAYVDGFAVTVEAGLSLLDACDAAGRYVPRLCSHPAVGLGCEGETSCRECGLCVVRMADGSTVRACATEVIDGATVSTEDPGLRQERAERLADMLARHPHVCLSCPDREGCSRDQCVQGNAPEARCCDELGRCELGRLVSFIDPQALIPRRALSVPRTATLEGRIRREPGLCVSCGRCVRICTTVADAGKALEMAEVAQPKQVTLRESGCTFCGLCVLVCPTGALTAPGAAGAGWLASRREKHGLVVQVMPPGEPRLKIPEDVSSAPTAAGVFTLLDASGEVLRVTGVADLVHGLAKALEEPTAATARWFRYEVEPLYTQRETELLSQYARAHGHLPIGNDLGDDLFADDF